MYTHTQNVLLEDEFSISPSLYVWIKRSVLAEILIKVLLEDEFSVSPSLHIWIERSVLAEILIKCC